MRRKFDLTSGTAWVFIHVALAGLVTFIIAVIALM
jgi:hypothetical protein